MNFISGRTMIYETLESQSDFPIQLFIINQILWCVAQESMESANDLIRFFDFHMNPYHISWFDAPNANGHRPLVSCEDLMGETDMERVAGSKISTKGVK